MNRSDFKKEDSDTWVAKEKVATSIAEFTVRLQTGGTKMPLSDEMIRSAEEFVALVRADIERIHDKVFECYEAFAANDPNWLEDMCGVPTDLDRAGVLGHLQNPALTVASYQPDGPLTCQVYFIPDWDEEHGLYIEHRNGKWVDPQNEDYEPDGNVNFITSPSEELMMAVLAGDKAKADQLIAAGMDINALAPHEIPPLWIAVNQMEPSMVRQLLEYGADPALRNPDDKSTPLNHARRRYSEMGFGPSKQQGGLAHVMAELARSNPAFVHVKGKLEEIIALLEGAAKK